MRKILLVVGELGYRGTPRTLANYASMHRDDFEVAVWGYGCGGETAERLKKSGFRVFVGDEEEALAVSYRPDIVNIHRPSVFSRRETDILRVFREQGARCVETSVFGRVDSSVEQLLDLSIQISNWDYYRWMGWKGAYHVPAVMIPNPVDVNDFKRASAKEISLFRERIGIEDDNAFVVGRIGKTTWRLLGAELLRALNAFKNLHVVLVDDYAGGVPEAIQRHERVHSCPRLSGSRELCAFYSACDVVVNMPKIGESFGFVNAEAMACETPVVTLSTPFHDNAQLSMVDGCGIALASPSGFGAAIGRMVDKGAEYTAWKNRCREAIASRYSFEVLGPKLLSVFKLVGEGRMEEAVGVAPPTISRDELYGMIRKTHGIFVLSLVRLFHTPFAYHVLVCCKACARRFRSLMGK